MASKRATAAAAPAPPATEEGFGYITDRQVQALGLDSETAAAVIADAAAVYDLVDRTPNVTRAALVEWAAPKWGPHAVDRLNAALAYLQRAEKVLPVP